MKNGAGVGLLEILRAYVGVGGDGILPNRSSLEVGNIMCGFVVVAFVRVSVLGSCTALLRGGL